MGDAVRRLIRFKDLQERGIVQNWPQLGRLQNDHGFPRGFLLGSATRVFDEDEVNEWLEGRKAAARRA